MAAAAHDHLQISLPREFYRRNDVLFVGGANHNLRGTIGNKAIPQSSINTVRKLRLVSPNDGASTDFSERIEARR